MNQPIKKPFVVKYFGRPITVFADSQTEAEKQIKKKEDKELMIHLIAKYPAQKIAYSEYNEQMVLECPICEWKGLPEGHIEHYEGLFDVTCPDCDKILLVVRY